MIRYFIFILIIFSACSKNKTEKIDSSKFYSDYDIFKRKGIGLLNPDSLSFPFIQVYEENDSIITLRIFTTRFDNFEEALIPKKDGFVVYKLYKYQDNPNYIFSTIVNDTVIRYGYSENPYYLSEEEKQLLTHQIFPDVIEIYTRNKHLSSWGQYDSTKKIIYPFQFELPPNAKYFDIKITKDSICWRNGNFEPDYFKEYKPYLNPSRGI